MPSARSQSLHCRFNRNIVECKDAEISSSTAEVTRFNRNIVECKVQSFRTDTRPFSVLIETLWNVKLSDICCTVLLTRGFNRNIVECKHNVDLETAGKEGVLIETLWNVKKPLKLAGGREGVF